jgi:hypothetical protein
VVVPLLVVHQLTLILAVQVAVVPVRSSQIVFPQVLPVPKVTRVLVVIAALVTLTLNPVAVGEVHKLLANLVYMAAVLVVTEPQVQLQAPRSHALAEAVVVSAQVLAQGAQEAQEEAAMAVQMLMALRARSILVAVAVVAVLGAQMPYAQAARVVLA